MNYGQFRDEVYSKDQQSISAHGWIQWKGTDVCVDTHCECGHHGHFDGDFFYFFECPACHMRYAVGEIIKLIPLTEEQAALVEKREGGFKTCDL